LAYRIYGSIPHEGLGNQAKVCRLGERNRPAGVFQRIRAALCASDIFRSSPQPVAFALPRIPGFFLPQLHKK
jgi:hypothetical protein